MRLVSTNFPKLFLWKKIYNRKIRKITYKTIPCLFLSTRIFTLDCFLQTRQSSSFKQNKTILCHRIGFGTFCKCKMNIFYIQSFSFPFERIRCKVDCQAPHFRVIYGQSNKFRMMIKACKNNNNTAI